MRGIKFAKLPPIEPEVLEEINREIEDLRENFIVLDLIAEEDIAVSQAN